MCVCLPQQTSRRNPWNGKWTITVGKEHTGVVIRSESRAGGSVRKIRLATASYPRLTAGEVSRGRHKKTAKPRVGNCGCECLQTIKTRHTVSRCTVSRQDDPVKLARHDDRPDRMVQGMPCSEHFYAFHVVWANRGLVVQTSGSPTEWGYTPPETVFASTGQNRSNKKTRSMGS